MPEDTVNATLLVVDDNATNLGVVCGHLATQGYRILTAENAASALRRLDRVRPDALLLDVMMPETSGFELARQITARADYDDQPIIFMTALNDTESKLQGFSSGGVDYITKPIQHEELLARVRTHLEVHRLRQALRRENARKDELIRELESYDMTVAHDLKNPIGAIASAAETFSAIPDLTGEEAREIIAMINEGATRCQHIIQGLLSFARLRQGEAEILPVNMESVIDATLRNLRVLLEEKQAQVEIERPLPAALGHAPWLQEVWSNLISNAAKYGGTNPTIIIRGDSTETGRARYTIRDHGPGLPANRDALFSPFSRGWGASGEGHGLGLSIVERILRRLGGSISATNAEDSPGAVFTLYLPLDTP